MDYEKFWDDLFRMAKQDEEYQWNLERVRGLEFIVLCTGAGAPMPSPMGQCHQLKDSISICQKSNTIIVQNTT